MTSSAIHNNHNNNNSKNISNANARPPPPPLNPEIMVAGATSPPRSQRPHNHHHDHMDLEAGVHPPNANAPCNHIAFNQQQNVDDHDFGDDPFDIANTKNASHESLKRWRVRNNSFFLSDLPSLPILSNSPSPSLSIYMYVYARRP